MPTRYLVIWSPLFEEGHSRHVSVGALHAAWQTKAPELVTRRTVELKTTSDPEILRQSSEWLGKHWGRQLKRSLKALSIVAIGDPVWQEKDGEERWKETLRAMQAGYDSSGKGAKPRHFYLAVERQSL